MDTAEAMDNEPLQNDLDPFERQLCDNLVAKGRLRESDLNKAERLIAESEGSFLGLMIRLGLVSERDVAEAMAALLELPLIGTKDYPDVARARGRGSRR